MKKLIKYFIYSNQNMSGIIFYIFKQTFKNNSNICLLFVKLEEIKGKSKKDYKIIYVDFFLISGKHIKIFLMP